jgi:hypothetical protein
MRIVIAIAITALLAGCGDSHDEAYERDHHESKKARVKREAKHVGHRTERAFRKVGGKLQKFFRGHDTISE